MITNGLFFRTFQWSFLPLNEWLLRLISTVYCYGLQCQCWTYIKEIAMIAVTSSFFRGSLVMMVFWCFHLYWWVLVVVWAVTIVLIAVISALIPTVMIIVVTEPSIKTVHNIRRNVPTTTVTFVSPMNHIIMMINLSGLHALVQKQIAL